MTSENRPVSTELKRTLGLYDVVSIIVGIIIGSAIYQTPTFIAGQLGSAFWIMAVWILGGVLSIIGALCYAELASAYPREGGDYFFLRHTYGGWAGFLYAWSRLWVIHSGNIALMAMIAGAYGSHLVDFSNAQMIYALLAVIVLTAINCLGLAEGKWTQNILATAQIVGLGGVILVAFFIVSPGAESKPVELPAFSLSSLFMASILVQFTFGGWSDCAFVASEVKQPEKNIFRALIIGVGIVTLVYCLINAALLYALGPAGMAVSTGIMAQIMEQGLGLFGGHLMAVIVVICALGSVNGMILVGGRIYHPFGRDHSLFRFFDQWNARSSVPLVAFVVQGIIACFIIVLFGQEFEDMVTFTASAHWFFMALVGTSLIVLRFREPSVQRPFRVPWYPLIPILYIVVCCALFYSSFQYANSIAKYGAWIGFALVLSGIPFYWISNLLKRS